MLKKKIRFFKNLVKLVKVFKEFDKCNLFWWRERDSNP